MTTAQPPAPPGPRQTPQARRSAPFPTFPPSPACGGPPAPAPAPAMMPGAPVRRSGRRQPALTPPRPPAHRRFAPPHRRHCSSLHCADRRRPALIHADRRRFTPTDADRSPGIAVVAPPHAPPRTAPDAPGTTEPRHPDGRGRVAPESRPRDRTRRPRRADPRPSRLPPVPPRAGSVPRARAAATAAATAAALHAAQATRQPLHAVRPPLGQRPPTAAVQAPTTEP